MVGTFVKHHETMIVHAGPTPLDQSNLHIQDMFPTCSLQVPTQSSGLAASRLVTPWMSMTSRTTTLCITLQTGVRSICHNTQCRCVSTVSESPARRSPLEATDAPSPDIPRRYTVEFVDEILQDLRDGDTPLEERSESDDDADGCQSPEKSPKRTPRLQFEINPATPRVHALAVAVFVRNSMTLSGLTATLKILRSETLGDTPKLSDCGLQWLPQQRYDLRKYVAQRIQRTALSCVSGA